MDVVPSTARYRILEALDSSSRGEYDDDVTTVVRAIKSNGSY